MTTPEGEIQKQQETATIEPSTQIPWDQLKPLIKFILWLLSRVGIFVVNTLGSLNDATISWMNDRRNRRNRRYTMSSKIRQAEIDSYAHDIVVEQGMITVLSIFRSERTNAMFEEFTYMSLIRYVYLTKILLDLRKTKRSRISSISEWHIGDDRRAELQAEIDNISRKIDKVTDCIHFLQTQISEANRIWKIERGK